MTIEHGGALDRAIARHGGERREWLDLSTGINPWAYPIPPLPSDAWTRLPEQGDMDALLIAARTAYDVPRSWEIVAAPGTQILLNLLPPTYPRGHVRVLSPTYSEHARVWRNAGHTVEEASEPDDADVIIAVNPNNPDGRDHLISNVRAHARRLCVVDEAFRDGADELSALRTPDERTIVLRSFGKFYGLAGIRLGFAIGPPSLLTPLRTMIEPWGVSGPALRIGAIALADRAWRDRMRRTLGHEAERLAAVLEGCGLAIVGRTNLFVTISHADAAGIYERLINARILVRVFDYAPTWLRFGLPANDEAHDRLLQVLRG